MHTLLSGIVRALVISDIERKRMTLLSFCGNCEPAIISSSVALVGEKLRFSPPLTCSIHLVNSPYRIAADW